MARRTQRVENLINNFMQYHKDGYSIPEIAEIFNVEFCTVYKYLQEIADKNGISRESLLERIKSPSANSYRSFSKEKIDIRNLQKDFDKVENDINQIISEIDSILSKENELS